VLEAATGSALERGDELAWARLTADLGALASLDEKGAEAILLLSSALSAFLAARDKKWGLLTARNAAVALVDGGETLEAEAAIRRAAKALRLPREDAADLYEWFGRVLLDRGQPRRAARAFGRAVSLYGATQVPRRSDRLGEIAAAFLEADAAHEAVRFFTQALSAHEPGLAEIPRYQLLNDRAVALLALGRDRVADADLSKALEQAREQQDRAIQATLLANLSEIRRRAGGVTVALGYAREAVALVRETANEVELADVLGTLGLAESAAIGPGAGETAFRTSLGLARKHRLRAAEAVALGGLAQGDFAKGRHRKALALYEQAALIEREQNDHRHEAESLAAVVEAAAHLRDVKKFEQHLQRLIDVVQKDGGPVDVALAGIARSGGVWLRHGELETAAETFSTGILLAAAEGGDPGGAPFARLVGRAVVAPFVYAHEHGIAADEVEGAIRRSLGARLAGSGRVLFDLFPLARDAASRTALGLGSRGPSRRN
jgi:tetratricopeptide (TPR) repeat protein